MQRVYAVYIRRTGTGYQNEQVVDKQNASSAKRAGTVQNDQQHRYAAVHVHVTVHTHARVHRHVMTLLTC